MAVELTPNLKLRIDDTLTPSARYNLERIDAALAPLSSVTVTLTPAQIKTLNSIPVLLVGAPAAGQAIIFDRAEFFLDWQTTAYSDDPNFQFKFTSGSEVIVSGETFYTATADTRWYAPDLQNRLLIPADSMSIRGAFDIAGPGDSPVTIKFTYHIIDVVTP